MKRSARRSTLSSTGRCSLALRLGLASLHTLQSTPALAAMGQITMRLQAAEELAGRSDTPPASFRIFLHRFAASSSNYCHNDAPAPVPAPASLHSDVGSFPPPQPLSSSAHATCTFARLSLTSLASSSQAKHTIPSTHANAEPHRAPSALYAPPWGDSLCTDRNRAIYVTTIYTVRSSYTCVANPLLGE